MMYGSNESNNWLLTRAKRPSSKFFLVAACLGIVGVVIGILIGRFAIGDQSDDSSLSAACRRITQDADPEIAELVMNGINKENIENNLRRLTEKPHIAGQQADADLVTYVADTLKGHGLDSVRTAPYDVLLSYPNGHRPDSVQLLDSSGQVLYDSISNVTYEEGVVPPFLAYSPAENITGDLMYVNYGRVEDYSYLARRNMSVKGKLVIARYGLIFRGNKVDLAAKHGAVGIVLYSDPEDYTWPQEDGRVYPDTIWLPPTAVQRGTIYLDKGDPLTPGYPATRTAYRYPEGSEEVILPHIPALPIGYGAALYFLQGLGGEEVPEEWRGGLNVTYRVGPLTTGLQVRLDVTSSNSVRRVHNVIGIIRGHVEPDRYVLFGNHRDAWVYGAIDPSSGTAVMLEIARVMATLVSNGRWRPRRSIMFCSWAAEEYGLVGSTEWVEQYISLLGPRAVAYINMDIAVTGNYSLKVVGTPLLYQSVFEASKKVPNPDNKEAEEGRTSVYDTWKHTSPWEDYDLPRVGTLGGDSDFAPMIQQVGITALDLRYVMDFNKYEIGSPYPLYHTEYDTFDMVKTMVDQDFQYHQAVGRVAAEMVRSLADSLLIPFNVSHYAWGLELIRQQLNQDFGLLLSQHLENYTMLQQVIEEFGEEVDNFERSLSAIDRNDPMAIRMVNDQLLQLERSFIIPTGLPGRPQQKHLLYSMNSNDVYAGSSFPGLVDLLSGIEHLPPVQQAQRWQQVRHHFTVILDAIQSAGYTLRDVIDFVEQRY